VELSQAVAFSWSGYYLLVESQVLALTQVINPDVPFPNGKNTTYHYHKHNQNHHPRKPNISDLVSLINGAPLAAHNREHD
jgi:hypothetical protein